MTGRIHVVGAGLAGLSTAVRLVEAGCEVSLWEAAGQAGGRCRTFRDPRLERDVDNGNHLVLSGNRSVAAYLATISATGLMVTLPEARFPFVDLRGGERWAVHLSDGFVPWWIVREGRRIPGTGVLDYLGSWRIAVAGPGRTVAEAIPDRGPLWRRFWEPLALAVLNTTPERGSARLLWQAMAETFARGGARCRPMLATAGLGRALVEPALDWLAARGVRPGFERALTAVEHAGGRATSLSFAGGFEVALNDGDSIVLALPPTRLKAVLSGIEVPDDRAAILNAHFTVPEEAVKGRPPITGLINAATQWVFVRGDVVSLTISAADRLGVMDRAPEDLIPQLWGEAARALELRATKFRAARINKERRATFDQSPAGAALRPGPRTPITNLWLAGDFTATGLPATIEGAIRSGETAARLAARGRA